MIPVNMPVLNGNEAKYLQECIDTGWISSEGPFVKRLETQVASYVGRAHGIAVSNGSGALDVAVQALALNPGDEVIMPTFTIISCIQAVLRVGAVPVLVDSDPVTWNMDVCSLESKITSKTKAIMAVHIYGMTVDMDPVQALAEKYNLYVIEDAAEAIGQVYQSRSGAFRKCGGMGLISTFSFYPNKHITTGEGGMILTDSQELAERCRGIRNLCFGARRFVHEELGYNYRMSNLQAAVGCAQFERLEETVKRKREIGARYQDELKGLCDLVHLPVKMTKYADNIYWVFGVVLGENVDFDAEVAMSRLCEKNVATRPFFWPMHEQPILRQIGFFEYDCCPVAERLARRGFYIPSGLGLTNEEISYVSRTVRGLLA